MDKEKTQEGQVTHSRSHSQETVQLGFEPSAG